ncbi:mannosyl-3-phosphoglycerate phosphatase [Hoeflea marina]|uniref:Mannosyl-3-phosphoglycerate phosphatase n=1 Tax=Hoeflea marina TaxID=274592 RepID=A0A317PLM8_9HYPH|nr:HAD-IIB family hydrolase [Hoeflea marina]PWW01413.1 mannosyl-3-phosphoglycerate phosphatase [Hoeflea marina]
MSPCDRLLVFTDLDGTLIDHRTYGFDAARPALGRLHREGHALVMASSKTAAEVVPLRAAAGFAHCAAIVENGAGILPPAGDAAVSGTEDAHDRLRAALDELPPALRRRFTGFSDWSVDEVSVNSGLDRAAASLARRRQFSEPGLWTGGREDYQIFALLLAEKGIFAQQGGRFLTLSFGATKGDRMAEITRQWRRTGEPITTVALGDAPNDITMLQQADIGVIIANPDQPGIDRLEGEDSGRVRRSLHPGPLGWNAEMLRILDELR